MEIADGAAIILHREAREGFVGRHFQKEMRKESKQACEVRLPGTGRAVARAMTQQGAWQWLKFSEKRGRAALRGNADL